MLRLDLMKLVIIQLTDTAGYTVTRWTLYRQCDVTDGPQCL